MLKLEFDLIGLPAYRLFHMIKTSGRDALNRSGAIADLSDRLASRRDKIKKLGEKLLGRDAQEAILAMDYHALDNLVSFQMDVLEMDNLLEALSRQPDLGDQVALELLVENYAETVRQTLFSTRRGYLGGICAGREMVYNEAGPSLNRHLQTLVDIFQQFGYKTEE